MKKSKKTNNLNSKNKLFLVKIQKNKHHSYHFHGKIRMKWASLDGQVEK